MSAWAIAALFFSTLAGGYILGWNRGHKAGMGEILLPGGLMYDEQVSRFLLMRFTPKMGQARANYEERKRKREAKSP